MQSEAILVLTTKVVTWYDIGPGAREVHTFRKGVVKVFDIQRAMNGRLEQGQSMTVVHIRGCGYGDVIALPVFIRWFMRRGEGSVFVVWECEGIGGQFYSRRSIGENPVPWAVLSSNVAAAYANDGA